MKILNKSEIEEQLKQVVTPGNKIEWGGVKDNSVILSGKFCSDELREIAKAMDKIFKETKYDVNIKRIQNLEIGEFKSKDIKVVYYNMYKEDSNKFQFSFFVIKDGKEYDFYYGKSDQGAGDWWPENDDEDGFFSPLHEFIPSGFSELCENMYEYRGSNETALDVLRLCGFVTEHDESSY